MPDLRRQQRRLRYGEVLERSLVHLGLKHYFLVDFPQEPGALRRFLDEVLGPGDDITLFEYVKRNNRETGEALVGVELSSAADLDGLRARMAASGLHVEALGRVHRPTATSPSTWWCAARRPNGRPAGWCRSRRRSAPAEHRLAGRGTSTSSVPRLQAIAIGPRRMMIQRCLVVVDGEVGQPRVGHRGLAVPQRDQVG